jgi:hypothetical protein
MHCRLADLVGTPSIVDVAFGLHSRRLDLWGPGRVLAFVSRFLPIYLLVWNESA